MSNVMPSFLYNWEHVFHLIFCLLIIMVAKYALQYFLRDCNNNFTGRVPRVRHCLPLLGHGIQMSGNVMDFLSECYKKYGKIFRIKIFGYSVTVLCDRKLVAELFKASESEMSGFENLRKLFFAEIFFPTSSHYERFVQLTKTIVSGNLSNFLAEIEGEAAIWVENLNIKVKTGEKIDIYEECSRFVTSTSARCLTGQVISKPCLDALQSFSKLLNQAVLLSYLLPKWALRLLYKARLMRLMDKVANQICHDIESHRMDDQLQKSMFLRTAVDLMDDATGKCISVQEVKSLYVHLLYSSSINTALMLSNTLLEMATQPSLWEQIFEQTAPFLREEQIGTIGRDVKCENVIIKNKLLHATIMESARINTQIISIGRSPGSKTSLGSFYLGDADFVGVCGGLLQCHKDLARDLYQDPEIFNPSRFLYGSIETMSPFGITAWGGGIHYCPGKKFALYEIKIGIAHFVNAFVLKERHVPDGSRRANHYLIQPIVQKLLDVEISSRP